MSSNTLLYASIFLISDYLWLYSGREDFPFRSQKSQYRYVIRVDDRRQANRKAGALLL